MSRHACPYEEGLLEAIANGRPIADASQQAHVAQCASCRELAEVALLLAAEGAAARAAVVVPPAGQVWWKAGLRARQEAARRVQRPMTIVQAFAAASTIGVLLALVTLSWPIVSRWLQGALAQPLAAAGTPGGTLGSMGLSGPWGMLVLAAVAFWLVLGPLAVYFLLRDDQR